MHKGSPAAVAERARSARRSAPLGSERTTIAAPSAASSTIGPRAQAQRRSRPPRPRAAHAGAFVPGPACERTPEFSERRRWRGWRPRSLFSLAKHEGIRDLTSYLLLALTICIAGRLEPRKTDSGQEESR